MRDQTEHVDEDKLNISVRKFLKEVGVTSQRAIEKAVRESDATGGLEPVVRARMTLEVPELGLVHVIDGQIQTE